MSQDDRINNTRRKNRLRSACQIEGCSNPLPTATLYHRRYHICLEHASLPSMKLNGVVVRFCQQCGRFQPLGEFDADKRSCRRKLQMHNQQRKRARDAVKGATACNNSPAGSPRGSTGTTFRLQLRPIRPRAAPEHELSHDPPPQPAASDPGTPACSPSSAPCCGPAPVVDTAVNTGQETATALIRAPENGTKILEIDELNIEELVRSWDDGNSADGGLNSLSGMLGGSVPVPPSPTVLSQSLPGATRGQAVSMPAAYQVSPIFMVPPLPPANHCNSLLQPTTLLSSSPFLWAAMPIPGPQQVMQVMPVLSVPAPAVPSVASTATTLPAAATDLGLALPAESPTYKHHKHAL